VIAVVFPSGSVTEVTRPRWSRVYLVVRFVLPSVLDRVREFLAGRVIGRGHDLAGAAAGESVRRDVPRSGYSRPRVRGREKVLVYGQVEVLAGGQLKVPIPRSSCRPGV
jgi:hypothetical protein